MTQHHNNRWNLTHQQCEVLKALALYYGRSKPAAVDLGLARKTVDNYIALAMVRMGVKNRREAIALWLEHYPCDSLGSRLAAKLHEHADGVLLFNLGRAMRRAA